ncbi:MULTISPECIES: ATP-dependent zinc metalloprotease FtsH [unclassified Lentimonas]|uniref:ATP-dependent zinc metalloprotease FtsH n=1 Tax=unclassified Lentimonas TaxID=2630993 RepID=UPI00132BD499|nr:MULTISPECIES: ATP-dependent zinc metalloprotease FtsH [unclassified Lentimonas]CAA6678651.1 Cell division protein FtsH (EC [Lentimonas sp. CC4]CAA6683637.1 Cell division protein FtsH (EC [Lentimonas sp. CC6]CAA7074517.1 Cell division protein FtsH (EC [Lentimonas sp. CC4]CAA7169130.1 Cell division protein FtsH (EC [Lentimonas sp. CC21]CAA7180466.1 Cell division protein FtsH (EC [Lentimonas sp. CC8]
MSQQNKPQQKEPGNNGQPERFNPKVLLIFLVIISAIIGLWFAQPDAGANHQRLTISELVEAVKDGAIVKEDKGVMKPEPSLGEDGYAITGMMKNPDYDANLSDETVPEKVHFSAQGRLLEKDFELVRSVLKESPRSTAFQDILISFLPFLLIIGLLYFLFVRQLKSAGKGAMSFGKSKAKMLKRDKDSLTFKDVAGCDEAKEEVSEVVDFLKDPKKFQRIGGRIPRGVLMVGPPGTGKTLLAKAVAGEAEVPFFSISGSDFVEMFVGVGAARVRDMFEQGRKNAPCIVFIDEIDAVGRQRGAGVGGGNDEREQTLNSLLVEMDGFDGHEGVIIIAATNRPDVLDSALLRPGRFDRQVTIDLPDLNGRHEILMVHAKKVALSEEVNLEHVARNTPGFSGADLANLLNEGALIAARYNKQVIEMNDLDEARDKISFGRERRRLMDDEDRKITAYHEAGHALIQAVVDDGHMPVHKVTIIPRGQSLGSTMFMPKKDLLNHSKRRLLNQICTGMGGRSAEEIVVGDITSGASGDIRMVTSIARHMVCDWGMTDLGPIAFGESQNHAYMGTMGAGANNFSEETAQKIDKKIYEIVQKEYLRSLDILNEHRAALDTMADMLLEHETIDGVHVLEILEHGEMRSPIIKREIAKEEPETDEEDEDKVAKKVDEDDDKDGLAGDEAPAPTPA